MTTPRVARLGTAPATLDARQDVLTEGQARKRQRMSREMKKRKRQGLSEA